VCALNCPIHVIGNFLKEGGIVCGDTREMLKYRADLSLVWIDGASVRVRGVTIKARDLLEIERVEETEGQ